MQDIIKQKGVRDYIQKHGKPDNIGGDLYAKLDERVKELLDRAQERANVNQRTTVKAHDL